MPNGSHYSRRTALSHMAFGGAGVLAATQVARGDGQAESNRKSPFQHSICRWCFNGKLNMDELAKNAARIGYGSIELIGPEEWPVAQAHGLTCAITNGTGPIGNCLNRKENHARCQAELRKNMQWASDVGIKNVICFSGNRDGQDDQEGVKICAEGLKPVLGLAEQLNVNICMELLNSRVDHKDYQFDHLDWGVGLTKMLGSPRFGILYDIYHAQIMEGDIIRSIRDNYESIKHYHTGGNPGRNEIDETQELNYSAIMRAIGETGYTGFVGQEFIPKGDPVASLEQAFAICNV